MLPVQLLTPPNNSAWERLPELTWTATSADKYRVEIRDPRDVDHPVHTAETTVPHYAVPDGALRFGQLYSWRVVALKGANFADDGDTFNFVLDHIPPPELTQDSVNLSNLPWSGGMVPVTVRVTSRTVIKEVRAIVEMPDGTRVQSLLHLSQNAAPTAHWEGMCRVPANRSDRVLEARVHFEAVDLTGHISSTVPQSVRIAPRNPQIGPRLELIDASTSDSPVHDVLRIRALRDRMVRASGIVYLLQVDDQVIATLRRTPFEFAWNSAEVSDGEHHLRLILRDTVTNASVVSDEIVLNTQNQTTKSP